MKRALLAFALCVASSMATAAGEYDGIWATDALIKSEYYTINQNGETVIFTVLNPRQGSGWIAFQGQLSGTSALMDEIINTMEPGGGARWRLDFVSPGRATFTLVSCTPVPGFTECSLKPGAQVRIAKIF